MVKATSRCGVLCIFCIDSHPKAQNNGDNGGSNGESGCRSAKHDQITDQLEEKSMGLDFSIQVQTLRAEGRISFLIYLSI